MQAKRMTTGAVVVAAVCFLACISVFGANGDKTKAKGMIVSRTGDSLLVSTPDGKVTVVMDDSTKVQRPTGIFSRKQVSAAVLIPGLKVSVDGETNDQDQIVAKSITFDADDLEIAEMIQAGLHPTAEQVAANEQAIASHGQKIAANQQATAANSQNISTNQRATTANKQAIEQNIRDIQETTDRFNQLSEYDVKDDLTLRFDVGSSKLSQDDQDKLRQLLQRVTKLTGYIIEVKGYADSTGNATMNTELSEDRAQAVVNYLLQYGGIPIRHVVAPGAYGETNAAASNETASGRAENRRVEVKVLVNKGLTTS